jgi:hypothetical protein
MLNKDQERLMKEKEDRKNGGRGGGAKFRQDLVTCDM